MNEVVIPGVDGDLTGVLLEPDCPPAGEADGPAGLPAVVVLPEIDGFCEGTVAAARRLAAAGYVALALDLYAPYGSAPRLRNSEDTRAWLGRLDDRRQLSDLAMAVSWLKTRPGVDPDRLGALGFSVGGRYGMMMTVEPHGLRAVVAFYSRPWPGAVVGSRALAPGEHVARFAVPVCAVFGADDEMVPAAQVDEFSGLLHRHAAVGHEAHVVPGHHFFANESRPRRYLPESAEKAWALALGFLAAHMAPRAGGAGSVG
ncbi:MAG: dienelactone hydrolase family protein [Acidimicrobiales bacterium]